VGESRHGASTIDPSGGETKGKPGDEPERREKPSTRAEGRRRGNLETSPSGGRNHRPEQRGDEGETWRRARAEGDMAVSQGRETQTVGVAWSARGVWTKQDPWSMSHRHAVQLTHPTRSIPVQARAAVTTAQVAPSGTLRSLRARQRGNPLEEAPRETSSHQAEASRRGNPDASPSMGTQPETESSELQSPDAQKTG